MAAWKTSEAGLAELRERWERSPGSHLFLQLAEEYRRRGDFDEAVAVLRKGILTNPSLAAEVALGRSLLEGGDALTAMGHLQNAVQRDPTQMVAYRHLVEAWIQLEDGGEADRCLEIYRQLNSRDPDLPVLAERIQRLQSIPPTIDPDAKDGVIDEKVAAADTPTLEPSDLSVDWQLEEVGIPGSAEDPQESPLEPKGSATENVFEKAALEGAGISGRVGETSASDSEENTSQPHFSVGPDQETQPPQSVALLPPQSSSSRFVGPLMDDDDDSLLFSLEPTPSPTFDLFSLPSRPLSWKSAHSPSRPDVPSTAGSVEVGVTATLGQIYLDQGHVAEATRIYRALGDGDEDKQKGLVKAPATQAAADEVLHGPDLGGDLVSTKTGAAGQSETWGNQRPVSGGLDQFVRRSTLHALESSERRRVLLLAYLERITQAKSNNHVS